MSDSANFVNLVTDMLLTDFRNESTLSTLLMNSAQSRDITARAIAAGGPDGFAKQISVPVYGQQPLSPTDGYTTISAFPGSDTDPDLSSAYPVFADQSVLFNIHRTAIGTHRIPVFEQWTHAGGSGLVDQAVASNLAEIRDQIESSVCNDMLGAGSFEVASPPARWGLDTSSQANLLTDLSLLHAQMNKQNVPKDERYLLCGSDVESVLSVKYGAGLTSRDFDVGGSLRTGTVNEIAGFKFVYNNNVTSGTAVAFALSKYALAMPKGIVVERSGFVSERIATYLRCYSMFGHGAIGKKFVASGDGNFPASNAQMEGILAITVS